jgi:ribosomal protein L44E
LQNLKSSDRTGPQGTIESRTSQNPASRGTNVERLANRPTRSQKEADRRVDEALKAIGGKNKPTPSMSKAQINEILRKRWKNAGPAQRLLIEKQAAILKNTPKKK